jgi:hypothetical protein
VAASFPVWNVREFAVFNEGLPKRGCPILRGVRRVGEKNVGGLRFLICSWLLPMKLTTFVRGPSDNPVSLGIPVSHPRNKIKLLESGLRGVRNVRKRECRAVRALVLSFLHRSGCAPFENRKGCGTHTWLSNTKTET